MYYIYGLIDPRDKEKIMYVGQTKNMSQRIRGHCKYPSTKQLRRWVESLQDIGLVPSYVVLDQAPTREESLILESDQILKFQPVGNQVLPKSNQETMEPMLAPGSLGEVERQAIIQALKANGNNKLLTAVYLKIGRQTLYNKIKLYGIKC